MKRILAIFLLAGLPAIPAGCVTTAPPEVTASRSVVLQDLDAVLNQLETYEFGDAVTWRPVLFQAFQQVMNAPGLKHAAEQRLVAFLQTDASPEAKRGVLRELSLVSGEASQSALATLARTEAGAEFAMHVLIVADQLTLADWRELYPDLGPEYQLQVVAHLAKQANPALLEFFKEQAGAPEPAVADAALFALARLGTGEAWEAMKAVQNDYSKKTFARARIVLADEMRRHGREPISHYQELSGPDHPLPVRVAALQGGLLLAENPVDWLEARIARAGPEIKPHVIRLAGDLPADFRKGEGFFTLDGVETPERVQLLRIFSRRQDASIRPYARRMLEATDPSLQIAGLDALAFVGVAEDVPAVLDHAASQNRDVQREAQAALALMTSPGVNRALQNALAAGSPGRQIAAITALVERKAASALPALVARWEAADPGVREDAILAVGLLGDLSDLGKLAERYRRTEDSEQQRHLEAAMLRLAIRQRDVAAARSALKSELAATTSSPELENALKKILARLDTPRDGA